MAYLFEDKTTQKAETFSNFLNQYEFTSHRDLEGTRDYLAKIDVYTADEYIGKVNVYYSPKKDSYKITCQSITILSFRDVLLDYWHRFDQLDRFPDVSGHDNSISAYVDGSFLNKHVGYGAVIIKKNMILHEISGRLDSKYDEYHQIGGELKAVLKTVEWCKKNKVRDIHIFYDYKGIEMWARAKWKAKNELTQAYQAFMIKQSVNFHFHKVAAHTGNRWNEYADQLAKKGTTL